MDSFKSTIAENCEDIPCFRLFFRKSNNFVNRVEIPGVRPRVFDRRNQAINIQPLLYWHLFRVWHFGEHDCVRFLERLG